MTAGVGKGYGYVYLPLGLPVTVDLGKITPAAAIKAYWYDPRTGEEKAFAILPTHGKMTLVPPSQGKGNDWVLVLEAIASK